MPGRQVPRESHQWHLGPVNWGELTGQWIRVNLILSVVSLVEEALELDEAGKDAEALTQVATQLCRIL